MLNKQRVLNQNADRCFRPVFAFVLSALFMLSCHSKQRQSALYSSAAEEQGHYRITLWQGGGYTGLTEGFTLSSTGEVSRWQKFPAQSNTTLWTISGHAAEVQRVKIRLEESGALALKSEVTGNMTLGVKYELQDKQYLWTWDQGGIGNPVTESFNKWYHDTLDFCRSLEKKN